MAHAKQKALDLVKKKTKGETAGNNTETVAAADGDDEEGSDGGDETSDASTRNDISSADVEGAGATTVAMKPYFKTTYVDEELSLGRTGQGGDLYVSFRMQHHYRFRSGSHMVQIWILKPYRKVWFRISPTLLYYHRG